MQIIYTDPHLGLNRIANTTPSSRIKLREHIYRQVERIHDAEGDKICVGDLFDTYSNDEPTLLQGYNILSDCALVLAGNHDVTNRKGVVGSLELLSQLVPDRVDITAFGYSQINHRMIGRSMFVTIPHVSSQALFEESLLEAERFEATVSVRLVAGQTATKAVQDQLIKARVLLLHCNYECPFADTETTLNLTEAWAERLLAKYDYVIVGHEHQPRDLFQGRLVILGNPHPTSFADISDKRIAILSDDGKLSFEKVWEARTGYKIYPHDQIPASTDAQFVRVTGKIDAGEVGKMSKAVAALWKDSEDLLAVKLDVEINTATVSKDGLKVELESLPVLIRKELAGTDMQTLFDELLERVNG